MLSSNGYPPEGWRVQALGDVADVRFSSIDKHTKSDETPVRLCNYMDVWKNAYIHNGLPFMEATATEEEIERFTLQADDVLITKDSETKDEIAEPSVVRQDAAGVVLGYHLGLLRPSPELAYGPFLAAQLRIPEFRAQFIKKAAGVTRYGLGLDVVRSAEVWLPPVPEQKLIAGALGAVDDAIELTENVIEQTRKLKEALVQNLLTDGLPGRHTEFVEVRLGDVFQPRKESGVDALPRVAVTMHNGLVNREEIERRMETNLRDDQHLLVRSGDIAYNMMRMWQGVFGLAEFDCLVSPAYVVVEPTGGLRSDYAAHLFKLPATIRRFHLFSQGLTEDRLRLYFEQFAPIKVSIPRSVDDQARIVELLATLDYRIASQSDELTQLTEAKSALSQALLTGQVRVPTVEVASA
ncbi:restriction endonuclease subunit S [Botrimarina mediterranea]|uniref:EcoKI restriction-modification system protein HsdS n=1 Tax=Botrimarina mediterranea TaxID=2528022 RepID=A0A518K7F0_9BACT|nr:restriction endonuclease subunit S [Botrimarina mediterranea]QDV73722.1 EcoKI restriction-modification system protein HsdS [Botrimarina mediterranea]